MARVVSSSLVKSLIVVSVFLFIGSRFLWMQGSWLDQGTSFLVYPFLKIQHSVVHFFEHRSWRKKRIAELEQQLYEVAAHNDELELQVRELQAACEYVRDTQEVRSFAKRYDAGKAVLAQIMIKQFDPDAHYLLIDAGSAHGVTAESIVVYKNCLVGRVAQVYPWYSKVIPITDASCKVGVYCGRSKVTGIHEGTQNLSCTCVQHVSHLAHIKDGDAVITSGKGLLFPRGFLVGKVVAHRKGALYQEIDVAPLVDLNELDYCYVINREQVT